MESSGQPPGQHLQVWVRRQGKGQKLQAQWVGAREFARCSLFGGAFPAELGQASLWASFEEHCMYCHIVWLEAGVCSLWLLVRCCPSVTYLLNDHCSWYLFSESPVLTSHDNLISPVLTVGEEKRGTDPTRYGLAFNSIYYFPKENVFRLKRLLCVFVSICICMGGADWEQQWEEKRESEQALREPTLWPGFKQKIARNAWKQLGVKPRLVCPPGMALCLQTTLRMYSSKMRGWLSIQNSTHQQDVPWGQYHPPQWLLTSGDSMSMTEELNFLIWFTLI